MTKVLERPKVPDRPPELWIEPPVREVPLPEKKKAAPPSEKRVAGPKQTGRWIRWMIVALVLAMATSVAFLALRDSGSDVVGTSHPLAEVYVVDATGTSHPLAEAYVVDATGTSHPLAEVNVTATGTSHPLAEVYTEVYVVDTTGTSHPLAEVYVVDATGTSHPLAEINVG